MFTDFHLTYLLKDSSTGTALLKIPFSSAVGDIYYFISNTGGYGNSPYGRDEAGNEVGRGGDSGGICESAGARLRVQVADLCSDVTCPTPLSCYNQPPCLAGSCPTQVMKGEGESCSDDDDNTRNDQCNAAGICAGERDYTLTLSFTSDTLTDATDSDLKLNEAMQAKVRNMMLKMLKMPTDTSLVAKVPAIYVRKGRDAFDYNFVLTARLYHGTNGVEAKLTAFDNQLIKLPYISYSDVVNATITGATIIKPGDSSVTSEPENDGILGLGIWESVGLVAGAVVILVVGVLAARSKHRVPIRHQIPSPEQHNVAYEVTADAEA